MKLDGLIMHPERSCHSVQWRLADSWCQQSWDSSHATVMNNVIHLTCAFVEFSSTNGEAEGIFLLVLTKCTSIWDVHGWGHVFLYLKYIWKSEHHRLVCTVFLNVSVFRAVSTRAAGAYTTLNRQHSALKHSIYHFNIKQNRAAAF